MSVGPMLYFVASDGMYGPEVWATEGTVESTRMLENIDPGLEDPPTGLNALSGRLLFSQAGGLWTTDGSTGGTSLLRDFGANPRDLVVAGDRVFFSARDAAGWELWRSDGTEAGTARVADTNPAGNSSPAWLGAVGDRVFFVANDGATDREPWVSDGTEAGTRLVKNIHPTGRSRVTAFADLTGTAIFAADDGATGYELWRSDGTEAGTTQIMDLNPGGSSAPGDFTALGEVLYFSADDGTRGRELWRTDGTEAGTHLVADLCATGDANPRQMTAIGSLLYFQADDCVTGFEPWVSDGTEAGTRQLQDIMADGSSGAFGFVEAEGVAYFAAQDARGWNLWRSESPDSGATLVRDLSPEGVSSGVREPHVHERTVFFGGDEGVHGLELWSSDGTESGTALVKDICRLNESSDPGTFLGFPDGRMLFGVDDGVHGSEPWITDACGTRARMLKDVLPGPLGGMAWGLPSGGLHYFRGELDGLLNAELWTSDGTTDGTVSVPGAEPVSQLENRVVAAGGRLFYSSSDEERGQELHVSDGTAAGSRRLDLRPGPAGSFPKDLAAFGARAVFAAYDETGRRRPWISDGTSSGTFVLAETFAESPGDLSGPARFNVIEDRVVFSVRGFPEEHRSYWVSDGTRAGTTQIADLVELGFHPSGGWVGSLGASTDEFALFKSFRFCCGFGLWTSDGTSAGTRALLEEEDSDFVRADNADITRFRDRLYFQALHAEFGAELWVSDGTRAGTDVLVDIHPDLGGGDRSSVPRSLFATSDHLYFGAEDGVHGEEPWRTDGTQAGTELIADIHPTSDSRPREFIEAGPRVYFVAFHPDAGRELFVVQEADADGDGVVAGDDNCCDAANPGQADLDDDGIGDACDCAPADPAAFDAGPAVRKLQLAKTDSGVRVSWLASEPATRAYEALTGRLSDLRATRGFDGACALDRVMASSVGDDRMGPGHGEAWYYLVRRSGACAGPLAVIGAADASARASLDRSVPACF